MFRKTALVITASFSIVFASGIPAQAAPQLAPQRTSVPVPMSVDAPKDTAPSNESKMIPNAINSSSVTSTSLPKQTNRTLAYKKKGPALVIAVTPPQVLPVPNVVVTITGPKGFHRTITKTTRWKKLPAGKYVVTTTPEIKANAGTYFPNITRVVVKISEKRKATVQLRYLGYVPDATKVEKSSEVGIVTGDANSPAVLSVPSTTVVGDVIVVAPSLEFPNGLLAKVTSVETANGQTLAHTTPATLTDAIPSGEFSQPINVSGNLDTVNSEYRTSGGNGKSLRGKNPLLKNLSCNASGSATVTGNIYSTMNVTMESGWGWMQPYLQIVGTVSAGASADLTVEGSASCTLSRTAILSKPLPLPRIQFSLYGVPVWINNELQFYVEGSAKAGATLNTNASIDVTTQAGVRMGQGSGAWFNPPAVTKTFNPPSLVGTAKVELWLGADVQSMLYGEVGGALGADIGPLLTADSSADPWWTLQGQVRGTGRVNSNIPLLSGEHRFPEIGKYTWVIADAGKRKPTLPPVKSPVNVSASAGDTTAVVSWKNGDPDRTLQDPITNYMVSLSTGEPACTANAPSGHCTVTGLVNDTPYSFVVKAQSSSGLVSPPSDQSDPVTPHAKLPEPLKPLVPSAPLAVKGTQGDGSALVSWELPITDGGSPILQYTVTSSPDNKTCITTETTFCTVADLTNGVSYTFTVTATNIAGEGLPSQSSEAVTPTRNAPNALSVTYPKDTFTKGSNLQKLEPTVKGGLHAPTYLLTGDLPTGVTFDQNTGVFTGPAGKDWLIPAFTPVSPWGSSHVTGVATAPDGSTYVSGTYTDSIGFGGNVWTPRHVSGIRMFVAKMGPDGVWQWAQGAGSDWSNQTAKIAVTPDGGAVLTGTIRGPATFGNYYLNTTTGIAPEDVFVAKISSEGVWEWATSGGGTNTDQGLDVAAAPDGSVYVTGFFTDRAKFADFNIETMTSPTMGGQSMFIAKLTSTGTWQWVKTAGGFSIGKGVAVAPNGSVYVAGHYGMELTFDAKRLVTDGGWDGFLAMISPTGTWYWATKVGGTDSDDITDVTVASDGSAYVVGDFFGTATFDGRPLTSNNKPDVFVAHMSPLGAWDWVTSAESNNGMSSSSITVAPDASVITTGFYTQNATFGGTTLTSSGAYDMFVGKLSYDGVWQWASTAGGPYDDYGVDVGVMPDGAIQSVGNFRTPAIFGKSTLDTGWGGMYFAKLHSDTGSMDWDSLANTGYPANLTVTVTDGTSTLDVPVTLQLN